MLCVEYITKLELIIFYLSVSLSHDVRHGDEEEEEDRGVVVGGE